MSLRDRAPGLPLGVKGNRVTWVEEDAQSQFWTLERVDGPDTSKPMIFVTIPLAINNNSDLRYGIPLQIYFIFFSPY